MQSKNNTCSRHLLLLYSWSESRMALSNSTITTSQPDLVVSTFANDCDGDVAGDLLDEILPVAVSPAVRGSPETGFSLPSELVL